MKAAERDERLIAAANAQARQLGRVARVLERPVLEAHRQPPAHLLGHGRGLGVALSVPGFAALWEQVVPREYVLVARDRLGIRNRIVLCPCGAQAVLERVEYTECPGDCGRWFLGTRWDVRVHRFLEDGG